MSTNVEINGVTFLPIKDAAKLVSYSRDYVARLAREQKIVATQISRQWFVDTISLKNFAESAELEQSVRKVRLSAERKREQVVKEEVLKVHSVVKAKAKHVRLRAQLVTVFVLGFGLVAGAGLYTTSALMDVSLGNFARLGTIASYPTTHNAALSTVVGEDTLLAPEPQATALFNNVVEQPIFIDEEETRAMSIGNSEGVFLLAREGVVQDAEEVQALFSDDVEVEFVDDSTGVITYTSVEGEETAFPFVSVPVKAASENLKEETL